MSVLAPIVRRSAGEICFQVDDVEPLDIALAFHPAADQLAATMPGPVLASSLDPAAELIRTRDYHPLVSAVHLAFSQHRPLVLTPDVIWLTIAQGFANHVRNNAEALRHRLVRHEGRREVTVTITEKPTRPEHWAAAIEGWAAQLGDHSDPELADLLLCDFSTTTPTSRIASQIVLMDVLQHYVDYLQVCICGIPTITLTGTTADWQSIRDRVERLGDYDLGWWTERLLVICDGLIQTAAGQPHRLFWQHIYKPRELYGGEVVTGWLADLFPYLRHSLGDAPRIRNPILEKRRPDVFAADYDDHIKTWMEVAADLLFRDDGDPAPPPADPAPQEDDPEVILVVGDGLKLKSFPGGLSQVPFDLHTRDAAQRMRLVAGFVGVSQRGSAGAIQPEVGWAVCGQTRLEDLFDHVVNEHQAAAPRDWFNSTRHLSALEAPKELFQMFDHFDGATLFAATEHPWTIRPSYYYARYDFHQGRGRDATQFIDLPDGRCIAYTYASWRPDPATWEYQDEWWVLVGRTTLRQTEWFGIRPVLLAEETVVVARGIEQFFARVFAAEGRYYFDDPAFAPDDTLARLRR